MTCRELQKLKRRWGKFASRDYLILESAAYQARDKVDYLKVFVGSGFETKGFGGAITACASVEQDLKFHIVGVVGKIEKYEKLVQMPRMNGVQ